MLHGFPLFLRDIMWDHKGRVSTISCFSLARDQPIATSPLPATMLRTLAKLTSTAPARSRRTGLDVRVPRLSGPRGVGLELSIVRELTDADPGAFRSGFEGSGVIKRVHKTKFELVSTTPKARSWLCCSAEAPKRGCKWRGLHSDSGGSARNSEARALTHLRLAF